MTRLVMIVVLAALAGCATQAQKSGSDEQTRADIQNRARIHTELGALYAGAGQMKTAVEEFKEALAADPGRDNDRTPSGQLSAQGNSGLLDRFARSHQGRPAMCATIDSLRQRPRRPRCPRRTSVQFASLRPATASVCDFRPLMRCEGP